MGNFWKLKWNPSGLPYQDKEHNMSEEQEQVTIDDLERIYFRAQDEAGKWKSVNAREATDAQFEAWITTRINIFSDPDDPWTPEARVNVLRIVQEQQVIYMLKKDVQGEAAQEGA
jgi:hypothetical protein